MPLRFACVTPGAALLAAVLATGGAGCGAPEHSVPVIVPVHRFVDPEWRARAETNTGAPSPAADSAVFTATWPVMSIADEALYAVGSATPSRIFYSSKWKPRPDGSTRVVLPVSTSEFPLGSRLALRLRYMVGAERHRLPSTVATVELVDGKPSVSFDLPLPAAHAQQRISLRVAGTILPKDASLHYRVPATTVPAGAHLGFSIGIQEPAWEQEPVEFSIRACVGTDCREVFREVLDPRVAEQRKWRPGRVDLAALAGREVAFSFETRLLSDSPDAFSLPGWGNPTVYAPVAKPKVPANIVMISLDTLAAGHLPTYGYRHATAPFLDGVLARDGTVFEHFVAAATTTPQSHMSMFTGVQPCEHGLTTGMEKVRPGFVTLAEVLRAAGYETGAVTEDGWLGYQHGFGHGFDFYAENKSADVMAPDGQIDVTLAKARAWIERNEDKPFFLFLHTFQVHGPFTPPKEYTGLFLEHRGAVVNEDSPRELREDVAYDQEIRYTDDQLKGLFEFLRARGLLENTIVVVTADHGEEFLEHGEYGHGRNLFEEVTHVPLVLWGPGRVPRGQRIASTAGHIDLMPTLLALAGVEAPAQAQGRDLLAPAGDATSDAPRFTESRTSVAIGKDFRGMPVLPPSFLVQHGTRKLARYREADGFRYEAYDLAGDPHERSPLRADDPAFASMKRALDDYEPACAARLQDVGGPASEVELDPEREEKLRALGYLQ